MNVNLKVLRVDLNAKTIEVTVRGDALTPESAPITFNIEHSDVQATLRSIAKRCVSITEANARRNSLTQNLSGFSALPGTERVFTEAELVDNLQEILV